MNQGNQIRGFGASACAIGTWPIRGQELIEEILYMLLLALYLLHPVVTNSYIAASQTHTTFSGLFKRSW